MTEGFPVEWVPRDEPSRPAGVYASGAVVAGLLRRLADYSEEDLRKLRGCTAGERLLLFGLEELLPWADGVIYLGQDAAAPALFVPTYLAPRLPAMLVERAFTARYPAPLVVLPAERLVLPAGNALPLSREALRVW